MYAKVRVRMRSGLSFGRIGPMDCGTSAFPKDGLREVPGAMSV